jgi:CRISPR-associated protein Cmx8
MVKAKKAAAGAGPAADEASAAKPAKAAKAKKAAVGDGPIEVSWTLAELPTSQHRAGLAGLVMLVRWINAHSKKSDGVLELSRCDATGATLRVDRLGMRRLYDAAYAASTEDKDEAAKRKNKQGVVQEPKAEVVRETVDPKTGKSKSKTVYVYEVTVPGGAFLLDEDPTRKGSGGLWIKLWRDFIWSIVRGVPAARGPYESRAAKDECTDGDEAYEGLAKGGDRSEGLASTYYLGAQSVTADAVPFEDRERYFFLLQFWPFAVSLYVTSVVDAMDGKRNFDGAYAVVVPDVSVLDEFCDELFGSLRERSAVTRGYRPEAAAIDLPAQAALAAAATLRDRLSRREAAKATASLVTGYEVIHVGKEGNNVRVYRSLRMAPSRAMVDHYRTIEKRYTEYFFRRQQIINLIEGRSWWAGYDRLFEVLPYERFMGASGKFFGRDARNAFKDQESEEDSMADGEKKPTTLASAVQRMVWGYATGRVAARTGVSYEQAKDKPSGHDGEAFNKELDRVTRDAFLAIRSRTGADFVDYFVGTICSIRQRVGHAGYELLSEALLDKNRIDEVRTLTMLALSTVSGVYEKKSDQH